MKWLQKLLDYLAFRRKASVAPNNDLHKLYQNVALFILFFTLVMLLAVLLFFKNNSAFAFFNVLTIISAYYFGGCALGFIFAIPKSAQNSQPVKVVAEGGAPTQNNDYYRDNTNLEEISDWLTKIIVGLSLTQFNHLQEMIRVAADRIAKTLDGAQANCVKNFCGVDFFVFAYALILLYGIAGLIIGYLWTRIDFRKILTQAREEMKENQELKERNRSLLQMINDPHSTVVTAKELDQHYEYQDTAMLIKIEKIVNDKPVFDKTDPQKGRWGGQAVAGNKQLSVEVSPSNMPGLYKVRITVSSIEGVLASPVAIILHPSFAPAIRLLKVIDEKTTHLDVVAYEAFTVAALTDIKNDSYTSLELDLNTVPNLPTGFYWTE